jgi:hypothetical protein
VPHFSCCWTPPPLQAHWGRWCHTHLLQPACSPTVHVGQCPSPPPVLSIGQPLLQAFPTPSLLSGGRHSCLLWLVYLQFTWWHAPPPLSGAQHALPILLCVSFFFRCLFIIQFGFLFFSLGGGQSVQRAMLICPRVVCGSTTCHLFAYLVVCISQAG